MCPLPSKRLPNKFNNVNKNDIGKAIHVQAMVQKSIVIKS